MPGQLCGVRFASVQVCGHLSLQARQNVYAANMNADQDTTLNPSEAPSGDAEVQVQVSKTYYTSVQAAERLSVSESGLRKYAGAYEQVFEPLPRNIEGIVGRCWPEEALERIEAARALVDSHHVTSMLKALELVSGQPVATRIEPETSQEIEKRDQFMEQVQKMVLVFQEQQQLTLEVREALREVREQNQQGMGLALEVKTLLQDLKGHLEQTPGEALPPELAGRLDALQQSVGEGRQQDTQQVLRELDGLKERLAQPVQPAQLSPEALQMLEQQNQVIQGLQAQLNRMEQQQNAAQNKPWWKKLLGK